MKKHIRLLSMVTAFVLIISSVGFAADSTFDEVMANTAKEYSEYIEKATQLLKADNVEVEAEKVTIFLMSEITDFDDDDIEHSQVFVYLPEKDSENFYALSFYSETKKHSGTAKNFDINGRLKDLYSDEVREVLKSIDSPEEIVNMRIGGRLSFLVYHIEAKNDDFVVLYDKLPDTGANYNEMDREEFEIEPGKIYSESEFLDIIHREAEAYKEYLEEKEDSKEVTYIDKNGDEKVKKPKENRNVEDIGDNMLCTCSECPDSECAYESEECECGLMNCSYRDCKKEAEKKQKEKKKENEDKQSSSYKNGICNCDNCPNPECTYDSENCECNKEDCVAGKCEEEISEKQKRSNKIKKVKEYGVFQGNEKGELNEDEYITRAEFAVVVCKMLGIEPADCVEPDEFDFDDVDNKHWAKGYIKSARKAGIIAGRGGNKYDPDARISYEEATKILVATMGYTPMAEQRGGYPYGYTRVAENLGLQTDLDFTGKDEALRGDIMEMVYNSLDVPMLIQQVFGDRAEYTIADGTNGKEMTLRNFLESK